MTICSDSQYTIDGKLNPTLHKAYSSTPALTGSTYTVFSKWIPGWRRREWKNSEGKPVANQDLIRYVLSLLALRTRPDPASSSSSSSSSSDSALANITFQKVKAHVGIEGNERADQFANNGALLPAVPERDFERAAEDNRRKLEARSRGLGDAAAPVPKLEEVEWSVELEELQEGDLLDEEELQRLSETQDFS